MSGAERELRLRIPSPRPSPAGCGGTRPVTPTFRSHDVSLPPRRSIRTYREESPDRKEGGALRGEGSRVAKDRARDRGPLAEPRAGGEVRSGTARDRSTV